MSKRKKSSRPRRPNSLPPARDRQPVREFQTVAGDPERALKRRRRLPVLIAFLASLPLLALSIWFSLTAASFLQTFAAIEVDQGTLVGLWIFSASGWLMLALTIIALWIALAKKTFRWRLTWSLIALGCAALVPLSWLFFL